MAKKHDQNFWINHINAFEKSGLSQAEYCRENKITPQHFSKLRNKYKKMKLETDDFIELSPSVHNNTNDLIKIHLSHKYTISIPYPFSKDHLIKLLDLLENRL